MTRDEWDDLTDEEIAAERERLRREHADQQRLSDQFHEAYEKPRKDIVAEARDAVRVLDDALIADRARSQQLAAIEAESQVDRAHDFPAFRRH